MTDAHRAFLGGLVGGALAAALILTGYVEFLELKAYDMFFRLRGPRPPRASILIVAVDDRSLEALKWPFPRALHGQLIDRLRAASPAAIGFDMIFSEPSSRGVADDAAFASAISRAGNVVLAALTARVPVRRVVTEQFLVPPLPEIRRGAAGIGVIDAEADEDGSVRQALLGRSVASRTVMSFAAELHRVAVKSGAPGSPLPRQSQILINFRGHPGTFPRLSYNRVLRGEFLAEAVRGRIVLVGVTDTKFHDALSTPFAQEMPGVEMHANILDTLLAGDELSEVPAWVSGLMGVALALLAGGLVGSLGARGLLAVLLVLMVVAFGSFVVFVFWNAWIRSVGPLLAMVLGSFGAIVLSLERGARSLGRL